MENLMLFLSSFTSYIVVFLIFAVAIIIAVIIGTNLRKSKNKKLEAEAAGATVENDSTEKV